VLNEFVIGPMMGNFPNITNKILSRSRGELSRLFFEERCTGHGSFKIFEEFYRYDPNSNPGDFLNKLMMESPAIKAARNRRKIAQRQLEDELENRSGKTLVVSFGGGNGALELEVIKRIGKEVYYCSIDNDDYSIEDGNRIAREMGLETTTLYLNEHADTLSPEYFHHLEFKLMEHFGITQGIDIATCHGFTEYLDRGKNTDKEFIGLIKNLYDVAERGSTLFLSQTSKHSREKYLVKGLDWVMRLRTLKEVKTLLENSPWILKYIEKEPMGIISMSRLEKY